MHLSWYSFATNPQTSWICRTHGQDHVDLNLVRLLRDQFGNDTKNAYSEKQQAKPSDHDQRLTNQHEDRQRRVHGLWAGATYDIAHSVLEKARYGGTIGKQNRKAGRAKRSGGRFDPQGAFAGLAACYPFSYPSYVPLRSTFRRPAGLLSFRKLPNEHVSDMRLLICLLYVAGLLAMAIDPISLSSELPGGDHYSGSNSWQLLKLWATASMALVLLYGPGFVWFNSKDRAVGDLALGAFLGPLSLSALGLACWLLGGIVSAPMIARLGLLGLFFFVGYGLWRNRERLSQLSNEITAALGIGMLLVGFAVAKANLSYAAPGELFHDTISRTLEVGGHSDSRIPYHTVQMIAHHLTPFAPETHDYFFPWSFASRGPLSGLLVAPIVLATGAKIPVSMPGEHWMPFDPQGFAAYRVSMIVLASLAGWAVYGVAFEVIGVNWALLVISIAFLAPFYLHEMYFTWPKMIAAGGVLTGYLLTRRSRAYAAGLVLGGAYLFHPSALLATPFIGVLAFGHRPSTPWKTRIHSVIALGVGLLLVVFAWQSVLLLSPIKQVGQQGFLDYFILADNHAANWHTWLRSRWDNFANTFLPFRLLFTDPTHESINSHYGPSDGWVHYGFLYWNTLPFAIGLPAFIILAPTFVVGVFERVGAALVFVIGPAALLVVYWGCASTGLMRHTGQWLFLSIILFCVWSLRETGRSWRRFAVVLLASPLFLIVRGLDLGWMALGTALHDHFPAAVSGFFVNDWISLGLAALFLVTAVVWFAMILATTRENLDE